MIDDSPEKSISLNKREYRVGKEIGRGGFATVYEAEDADGKTVAIKWIPKNHPSYAEFSEMERRGAEISRRAARSGIEGIAEIYDYGVCESGFAIVMDYFEEGSLAKKIEEKGALPLSEARGLLLSLAKTVEALHAQSIIHRDIGPRNMLVREGRYFLCDFGTLRYVRTRHTQTRLGSMGFSAPECFYAEGQEVDARADVYSLGALLFFVLTGINPEFREEHIYRLKLPYRKVVLGACRFRVKDRTASVAKFIAPIRAGGLRKVVSRIGMPHRTLHRVALAAILAVVLGVSIGAAFFGARSVDPIDPALVPSTTQDDEALASAESELILREAQEMINIDPDAAIAIALRSGANDDDPILLGTLNAALLQPLPKFTMVGHKGRVDCCDISPDGKTIASGSEAGVLRVWSVESGHEIAVLEGHTNEVWTCKFSPSGGTLASAGRDGMVILWDTSNWGAYKILDRDRNQAQARWMRKICFSEDERFLYTSRNLRDPVEVWDLTKMKFHAVYPNCFGYAHLVKGSYDFVCLDSHVDETGADNVLRRINIETGEELWSVPFPPHSSLWAHNQIKGLCYVYLRHKGGRIISLENGGTVASAAELGDVELDGVAFSESGETLVLSGKNDRIYQYSVGTKELVELNVIEGSKITGVGPKGELYILTGEDKLEIWCLAGKRRMESFHALPVHNSRHTGRFSRALCQHQLLVVERNSVLRVFDLKAMFKNRLLSTRMTDPIFLGKKALVASIVGTEVEVRSAEDLELLGSIDSAGVQNLLGFTPDGDALITATEDGQIDFWKWREGRKSRSLKEHDARVAHLFYSRDNSLAITCDQKGIGEAVVWRTEDWTKVSRVVSEGNWYANAAFKRDNSEFVMGSFAWHAGTYDTLSGKEKYPPLSTSGNVLAIDLANDEKSFFYGDSSGAFAEVGTESGERIRTIKKYESQVLSALLSEDGTHCFVLHYAGVDAIDTQSGKVAYSSPNPRSKTSRLLRDHRDNSVWLKEDNGKCLRLPTDPLQIAGLRPKRYLLPREIPARLRTGAEEEEFLIRFACRREFQFLIEGAKALNNLDRVQWLIQVAAKKEIILE